MATELDQDLVLLAGVVHSATPLALCQAIYLGESESWPNAIKKLMGSLPQRRHGGGSNCCPNYEAGLAFGSCLGLGY